MTTHHKILKSQPPDVTISVGSGFDKQKFKCYKVILCQASDYFDVMFSIPFSESGSHHVEFPDKDPEGWTHFYNFICPGNVAVIDSKNVQHLLPWFHQCLMETALKKCDEFLSNHAWKGAIEVRSQLLSQEQFDESIRLYELAVFYGMEEAKEFYQTFMEAVIQNLKLTKELFDTNRLEKLIGIEHPLQVNDSIVKLRSFWSELPPLVKTKLEKFPSNSFDDTIALAFWMKTCIEYHFLYISVEPSESIHLDNDEGVYNSEESDYHH